ncbi:hypothetical protein [Desulfitobacterium hafniense]|uniref:hypothetical protein n=1 Tax=Desulfitobacterium hafniense TaxID=49338 RepID=UPI00036F98D0|nr:hypothetical protein [Desulfitobacterium hafniense]
MDDKMFALLEKMYREMQKLKQDMATKQDISNMATKQDIANMATKQDIANMATKQDIANMATRQDIVRLEDKMDTNFKALYDGYTLTYEKLSALEDKVDKLSIKVENQNVEIKVIKAAK